ncbi:metallophosphoesterase family protein [Fulvivirga sp. M361]|uniref:metallophosphoesterase family protein n=1 Tax=Fulvivirga sp. M361 TaxID=2594266 RepID=UPI00117A6AFA|nr:metallophosphoesterase family protein [Fulvivirga sp. M361]TRX56012.1 metallophosphoesterase family protein [Fulvivirga sp. M361]
MKIGLLSDTHGHLDDRIFQHFESCDEIWHAGDIGTSNIVLQLEQFKTFRGVYGNIDGHDIRTLCPEDLWFSCEGLNVWITHIGGYPPRYNARTKKVLADKVPDIFICGHSHILKVIKDPKNGLLHINPGAAGIQGFHKVKTLMRFEINQAKIENMQVIELGKRA